METSSRSAFLETVNALITGDRNVQYGEPTQDFERTARLWSVYLDKDLSPHDVAVCQILLKISRITHNPTKEDSWIDIAGYAACGWECLL